MHAVAAEDEWNDTYGRSRMHDALKLKDPETEIPGERTIYRIMGGTDYATDHSGKQTGSRRRIKCLEVR